MRCHYAWRVSCSSQGAEGASWPLGVELVVELGQCVLSWDFRYGTARSPASDDFARLRPEKVGPRHCAGAARGAVRRSWNVYGVATKSPQKGDVRYVVLDEYAREHDHPLRKGGVNVCG